MSHGEIDDDERSASANSEAAKSRHTTFRDFSGLFGTFRDFSGLLGKPFHTGADLRLIEDFVETLNRREHRFRTAIADSVESHRICFEAERSRLFGKTVSPEVR